VPESLLAQVKIDGPVVIPVGSGLQQRLMRYTRTAVGIQESVLEMVHFVPLKEGVG